jgi:DNA-binding NarL/FixJ family response regulator
MLILIQLRGAAPWWLFMCRYNNENYMNTPISIALVDDHQIVLDGLRSLLEDEPQFQFAFCSAEPRNVLELLAQHHVDVLLTDVMMPQMPGNILAREVRKHYPAVKIMALSMNGEGDLVNEMINDADIAGYALKNISKKELVHALEKIAAGGNFFSEAVLEELSRTEQRKKVLDQAHLTAREIEIIRLVEKENNNRQIAELLFISERTVETHRKNILRKLGINSTLALIKYAYEHRLIDQ